MNRIGQDRFGSGGRALGEGRGKGFPSPGLREVEVGVDGLGTDRVEFAQLFGSVVCPCRLFDLFRRLGCNARSVFGVVCLGVSNVTIVSSCFASGRAYF